MPISTCLHCGTSEQDRPLVTLKFLGLELAICPQYLPVLIHKPYHLADKPPTYTSTENLPANEP